ncbi:MAG: HpcH/HpaI aldolase/citrate lyase family protein [Dehalococcoidia bacterium]
MFVPADRKRMVARAADAGADAVVLDLEDAVPPAAKPAARAAARRALDVLSAHAPVFVRVNGVRTGLARDDILAVVYPGLAGVVLPKAEAPQDLRDLDVLLREAEMAHSLRPGDVAVVPIIESPRGLLRADEIARASDRVQAISLGAEDYCAELEVERNVEGTAIAYLRYQVVQVAAANGLIAIDTPYPDVRDREGLVAETRFARAVGFKGKYVLHPDQVAPVNDAFTPSDAEVARAHTTLAAYDSAHTGAVNVDGRMVDAPVAERARRLIQRAEAIARRDRAAR